MCSLAFVLSCLDSIQPIYKIIKNEMTNVTRGLYVNFTQPGNPREYWNELVSDYIPELQSIFAVTAEMKGMLCICNTTKYTKYYL